MPIENALNELGKAIQTAQDDAYAHAEVRATLLANFGPTSRSLERYGFQIETEGSANNDRTIQILVFVLEKLIERGGKSNS